MGGGAPRGARGGDVGHTRTRGRLAVARGVVLAVRVVRPGAHLLVVYTLAMPVECRKAKTLQGRYET